MLHVDAPHFCAGAIVKSGVVVQAAPIMMYMEGWSVWRAMSYCRKKGWKARMSNTHEKWGSFKRACEEGGWTALVKTAICNCGPDWVYFIADLFYVTEDGEEKWVGRGHGHGHRNADGNTFSEAAETIAIGRALRMWDESIPAVAEEMARAGAGEHAGGHRSFRPPQGGTSSQQPQPQRSPQAQGYPQGPGAAAPPPPQQAPTQPPAAGGRGHGRPPQQQGGYQQQQPQQQGGQYPQWAYDMHPLWKSKHPGKTWLQMALDDQGGQDGRSYLEWVAGPKFQSKDPTDDIKQKAATILALTEAGAQVPNMPNPQQDVQNWGQRQQGGGYQQQGGYANQAPQQQYQGYGQQHPYQQGQPVGAGAGGQQQAPWRA